MARKQLSDPRRFSSAIDRLDAVSPSDRQSAARHVFDVCVFHVSRVRKTHPGPHHRGHGRLTSVVPPPTAQLVFDIVYPHIYRISRRLDRAMRYAETSPHPADAAALIVAVDAQGALAALFAVAQNAGVPHPQLDALALPLRKRSAPALLRTLFSPDMRVANAAKKALRQVAAIACCQNTPWMSTIRAALSLRSAPRINRSILLRNLLARLGEILHLVVSQAATTKPIAQTDLHRKRSSRSSFGNLLMARPRPSLAAERRAQEKQSSTQERLWIFDIFRRKQPRSAAASLSNVSTHDSELPEKTSNKKRFRITPSAYPRKSPARIESDNETHSILSGGASYVGSAFSSVTESGASSMRHSTSAPRKAGTGTTIKRDAATAMYIFERLLAKRTNPDLNDRVEVITTLADIASATFSGHYAKVNNIEQIQEYSDAMAAVFSRHGQRIYAVILEILFRPVREADANRIGVFSFHEAGITDYTTDSPLKWTCPVTQRKMTDFPQSAICLPNMDCTGLAAVSCNSLLKVLLRFVPDVCTQRMALLTGTINSAFLHASEALQRGQDGCQWEVSKIVSTVDALTVLVAAVPPTIEASFDNIIREPVTLRLVIDTCIRSVSATGRLLAQNAARSSAPKLSDEGTLDSLRSWQALIKIIPGCSQWSGTPSYSSSILFLAQVARRAALISVVQGYRRDKYANRKEEVEANGHETYPSVATLNSSFSGPTSGSLDEGSLHAPPSLSGISVGLEGEEENPLTGELQQCIVAMVNVGGTSPGDIFFELYRTIVYLYANDLKKHHQLIKKRGGVETETLPMRRRAAAAGAPSKKGSAGLAAPSKERRSQSDEDAKGILVENIAVDGQLPSRALRRAVIASELDLGEYFDCGQPLSLQHLGRHKTGLPPGMHTFEEFSHALAIIIGTLSNKSITENFEDPHEAASMITRDVQRSGSAYLKKVHKRARSILRRDMLDPDYELRTIKYEDRIRKLEEQVASLKSMMQTALEDSVYFGRRKALPKLLSRSSDSHKESRREIEDDGEGMHEFACGPARCFCVT